ncbi:MAG TPA: ABC transporter ATP-binding protein [Trebonia sp.]
MGEQVRTARPGNEAPQTAQAEAPGRGTERPAAEPGYLEVTGLTRDFGGGGVHDVTFSVPRGKLVTLLGPSGCGKTTTLRCIAGIEVPEAGAIRVGDRMVTSTEQRVQLRPERRDIGMVFQSYALWPHMSVFENVAFPLRMRHERTAAIRPKVDEMLELVGLAGMGRRRPGQLSGGQQQRVALARALVYRPSLLLLDEPLSNLDAALRDAIRRDIGRVQRELGITAVYVTHDQDEAMMLSDQIIVMKDGSIVQDGTPAELLAAPASLFVARLLGQANVIEGVLVATRTEAMPDGSAGRVADVDVSAGQGERRLTARLIKDAAAGDRVSVVWRPGDLVIEPAADRAGPPPDGVLAGEVVDVRAGSSLTDYTIDVGPAKIRALRLGPAVLPHGSRVVVSCPADRAICLRD